MDVAEKARQVAQKFLNPSSMLVFGSGIISNGIDDLLRMKLPQGHTVGILYWSCYTNQFE